MIEHHQPRNNNNNNNNNNNECLAAGQIKCVSAGLRGLGLHGLGWYHGATHVHRVSKKNIHSYYWL